MLPVFNNLQQALLRENSKANTNRIKDYIGADEERFAELMTYFLGNDYRTTQRAVWVVSYCVEAFPFLIEPYWPQLIESCQISTTYESVKRNIVRMWQFIDIPEQYEGNVMDFCLNNLTDASIPIATKAFSVSVLEKLCLKYSELVPEVSTIIKGRISYESPAFQSRGQRFLRKFRK